MRRFLPLFLLFLVPAASAQEMPFDLPAPLPGITGFDASIPTPESVMGHRIGTRHTAPHEVVRYFEAVAAASDRVTLHTHAVTHEGRPLIHAIVTTPSNHADLDGIKARHQRLSDSPDDASDEDITGMPVVLYQGYSIHGNEATGTEAALLYIYYLAAGQGPAVEQALEQAIVIVDPMFNPDGRDRFADWVNRNRGDVATTDPNDREHNEPWPGGRTNHYWFDLNRDWLPAQHPESQGRMKVFHDWRPQVLTDHHEMGGSSTFFFQPGIPSRNNPNTPENTYALTAALGEYHAGRLDGIGASYYSEESFDDFYLGKGSSFPDVNGTVGILFEQASSRALLADTPSGLLSYAYGVRNQFVTSLSTLEGGVALREDLLRNHRDFYATGPESNGVTGYVVGLERGASRADSLLSLLRRHQIEAFELAEDVTVGGQTFRAGAAAVLPIDQRQGRLLEAAFERVTSFEDSLFYDVSTWTLPLAFDVDHAELRRTTSSMLGEAITGPRASGMLSGGEASYAYLMPWNRQYAPRALYRLQDAGVSVRLMTQPFAAQVNGSTISFDAGTVVIPVRGRDAASRREAGPDVHELVRSAVDMDGVHIYAVDSGLTPSGPDLGGASTEILVRPTVAIITGSGSSSYGAGELWHYFSEHLSMPASLLDADQVGRTDLSRYTAILLGGGSYNSMDADAIKSWLRSGGRLIAIDSAMEWAADNGLLDIDAKPFDTDSLVVGLPYEDLSAGRGAHAIGGSIFEVALDTTHPVAYGMPERLPVLRQGSRFYSPTGEPGRDIGTYTGLLSGYLSDEKAEDLQGALAIVGQSYGSGRVLGFSDRLAFRAFFYGSTPLIANAVFFARAY